MLPRSETLWNCQYSPPPSSATHLRNNGSVQLLYNPKNREMRNGFKLLLTSVSERRSEEKQHKVVHKVHKECEQRSEQSSNYFQYNRKTKGEVFSREVTSSFI